MFVDVCIRCGLHDRDSGNDKCLSCFAEVDPVGYQQTIDHRRRKAEKAEAERKAIEAKKKMKTTPNAVRLMNEMKLRRDLNLEGTRIGPFCKTCENRGELRIPSLVGGHCDQCVTRHRLALEATGLPDFSKGPRYDDNHFPPEVR